MKPVVTEAWWHLRTRPIVDENSRIDTKIVSFFWSKHSTRANNVFIKFFFGLLAALLINACDVSDGSGIGGEQEPDPVVVDFPIAYVERPIPLDEDGNLIPEEILDPGSFRPGARLVLKDRASAMANETILTAGLFLDDLGEEASYDVKDLAVSGDGKKLLFSMRAPEIENAGEFEQPTWNIWEYDLESAQLRRIIPTSANILAEQGHDVAPQYLPDGRIVFSSNRQRRTGEILLDEQKGNYPGLDDKRETEAFVLHVMEDDGTNLQQITFNVSHDLYPSVLPSGKIMFLRWDAINNQDRMSLYSVNPDGSQLELTYGFHSQNTGTENTEAVFTRPKVLEDGRVMVSLKQRETPNYGGQLVTIDTNDFIDVTQPTYPNAGASGPAQESLTNNNVDTRSPSMNNGTTNFFFSRGGYFQSASPLYDGTERLIVSWSQCRLLNNGFNPPRILPCTDDRVDIPNILPADLLYGLWVYDARAGTQLPIIVPEEGTMLVDPVVIKSIDPVTIISPEALDADLVTNNLGVIHIRNVYDLDGVDTAPDGGIAAQADPTQVAPDDRAARFIRIVKAVSIPDPDRSDLDLDNSAFGVSSNQGMRDILGYVPVEPDGSAKFVVPADMPLMLGVLNAQGQRISPRHEVWLNVRPGEVRECKGCHERTSLAPHGRADAEAPSIYAGALGGMPFPNTQLFDSFGMPERDPENGETMAEYHARITGNPRTPSMDLVFTDEWTDPASGATPGTDISLRYISFANTINNNPSDSRCMPRNVAPPTWYPPTECLTTGSWTSLCRVTINYLDTIHPLWTADRRECDDMGNLVRNVTCTDCHNRIDSMGMPKVPDGQLELTGEQSQVQNDFITSYAELFFQNPELELDMDSLVPARDPPVQRVDENGELVFDDMGQPVFDPGPIRNVNAVLNTAGAIANNARFFSLFAPGGSHSGRLSSDELKLIAEWLDIGGQYYNNPYDAPTN